MALGTSPNPLLTNSSSFLFTEKWGGISVNESGQTSIVNVYAGGDAVSGAATVILAMGAGKKCAKEIIEKEKQSQSTIKERFNILLEVITDISKDNKLNLMIHDGQATYIHSNMRQTLHYLKGEDSFLVATTPVTEDEGWKEVELNKLFALVDGNIIYESKEHINEFIQTKKHEEYLNKSIKSIKEDE
jgi:hypothetical protein